MNGNHPPQAFVFRTVKGRLLEIGALLALATVLGISRAAGRAEDVINSLTRYGAVVVPIVTLALARKSGKTKKAPLLGLAEGLILAFLLFWFLPPTLPLPFVIAGAVLAAYLTFYRPRLPAVPLVLALVFLAWPDALMQTTSPLQRAAVRLAAGESIDRLTSLVGQTSDLDRGLTENLNNLFAPTGLNIPTGYWDVFEGLGSNVVADWVWPWMLLVFLYLWPRGYLCWRAPLGFLLGFIPMALFLGGVPWNKGVLEGDVLFLLSSGSFMIPMLWYLSDYHLLPLGTRARFLNGLFAGLFSVPGLFSNLAVVPHGVVLILWLLQRFFERLSVDEVYHRGDAFLLFWRRNAA